MRARALLAFRVQARHHDCRLPRLSEVRGR